MGVDRFVGNMIRFQSMAAVAFGAPLPPAGPWAAIAASPRVYATAVASSLRVISTSQKKRADQTTSAKATVVRRSFSEGGRSAPNYPATQLRSSSGLLQDA